MDKNPYQEDENNKSKKKGRDNEKKRGEKVGRASHGLEIEERDQALIRSNHNRLDIYLIAFITQHNRHTFI